MQAIRTITHQEKIPKDILTAVALTETGTMQKGRLLPYPWAINVAGKGFLFPNKAKAIEAVKEYLQQGITSIDIGCMQLNWYWHKSKFDNSVEKAFDPLHNITVGANYIKEHYRTYNNWNKAVGRYHSGTAKYALAYHQKFAYNLKIVRDNSALFETDTNPVALAWIDTKQKNFDEKSDARFTMLYQSAGALITFEPVDNKPIAFIQFPKTPVPLFNSNRRRSLF
jgi:hypothetical protein